MESETWECTRQKEKEFKDTTALHHGMCSIQCLNSGEPLKQINPASQIPAATHSVLTPFFSAHEHTVMATHCEVTMVVPMRMVRVMMQIVMATRGAWLGGCGTREVRDGKRTVVH